VEEAPTSAGEVREPDDESVARAYLNWGKEPASPAGKATGTQDDPPAVTRADAAPGGVTRPDGTDGGLGGTVLGDGVLGDGGLRDGVLGRRVLRDGGSAPRKTSPRAAASISPVPFRVLLGTGLGVILLDAATKIIVVATLSDRPPVKLIPGVLELELTRNSGAAFSIGGGATVLFSLIALIVVAVVARTARRLASVGWAVVLGMIVGGAVGNLIDRLVRSPGPLRGHVVDWIYLHHWPIFNVADSSIVIAAVLAVVLSALGVGLDGRRLTGAGRADRPDAPADQPDTPAEQPTAGRG
jgi:signal peptidase II